MHHYYSQIYVISRNDYHLSVVNIKICSDPKIAVTWGHPMEMIYW